MDLIRHNEATINSALPYDSSTQTRTLIVILICGLDYDLAQRTDCLTSALIKKVKRVQI